MLRKIFIAAFMATLIVSQNVSAEKVLIYEDDDDFTYYVITDSIVNRTQYRDNPTFDMTLSIYYRGNFEVDIAYHFWYNDGLIWCSRSNDGETFIVDDVEPMKSAWNFGVKFLGIDYEVSYQ